jgi:hypothetical protein
MTKTRMHINLMRQVLVEETSEQEEKSHGKSWNKFKIIAKNKLTEHSTPRNTSDWLRSL